MYQRYAVYFTPEGELAARGAAWLGWDVAGGRSVTYPEIDGVDVAALTATPRKYGLHGTIKPPFFLADGKSFEELQRRVADLCTKLRAVQLDGLTLSQIGTFLALVPRGDQTALAGLAAQVVTKLDVFRAPTSEQELERRRATLLSPAQERHLANWGYPYVMDEFRFHITLTGRIDHPDATRQMIEPYFEPVLPEPFVINSLTLVGQDEAGMFHKIHRYTLSG